MLTLAEVICVSKPVSLSCSNSDINCTSTYVRLLLKIRLISHLLSLKQNKRIDRQAPEDLRKVIHERFRVLRETTKKTPLCWVVT